MIRGVLSSGYSKIKFLQKLDWCAADTTLRCKPIDLNNFKSDIISEEIKD